MIDLIRQAADELNESYHASGKIRLLFFKFVIDIPISVWYSILIRNNKYGKHKEKRKQNETD